MFIIWRRQEQSNSLNETGSVLTDVSLANGNKLNLILPTLPFFLIKLLGTAVNKYCYMKIVNDFEF